MIWKLQFWIKNLPKNISSFSDLDKKEIENLGAKHLVQSSVEEVAAADADPVPPRGRAGLQVHGALDVRGALQLARAQRRGRLLLLDGRGLQQGGRHVARRHPPQE